MIIKIVYLDTETTSLEPGQICQLSYIIQNDKQLIGKNFYFEVDEMDPGAEQIHGLSIEHLKELSKGQKFNDIKFELLKDLDEAIVVGHNINFDLGFVNYELGNLQINNESFCTMSYFTNIMQLPGYGESYKWPRLSELVEFLEINENQIIRETKKIFKVEKVDFHDARFDVVSTYLSYKKGLKNGLIPKDRNRSKEYLEGQLTKEDKNKFSRYTMDYKSPQNKVLYYIVKKYFPDAVNVTEIDFNKIGFKIDKIDYEVHVQGSAGVIIQSEEYKENGLLKHEIYKLSYKHYINVLLEAFSEIDILLMFRNLCCWLDRQKGKASYSFNGDLSFIIDNIELRNKARDMGLIFYGTGWGWRLRKNWEDVLEREFQKLELDN